MLSCFKSVFRRIESQLKPKFTCSIASEIQSFLNTATGYDACEKLKNDVLQKDQLYSELKEKTQTSRLNYFQTIDDRAKCQRELNTLLQRKHVWTEDDVNRFTELYKNEMRLEGSESSLKQSMQSMEKNLDSLHLELMNAIRERYQQEQLWSDKIRKFSSYGTFGLLAFNLILFISIQFVFEPKKKKKLIDEVVRIIDSKKKEDLDNLRFILSTAKSV